MHKKLIAVLIGLVMLLGGGTAGAAEKQDRKTSNKPIVSSSKCWQRVWRTSEAFMGKSTMPVCKAFEEVLNTTCELPNELQCNWTLPQGGKRFEKLKWEPLNWRDHWELVGDLNKTGIREDGRAELWKREEARIRDIFEEGKGSLAVTRADIDHDGKAEYIVRWDLISCKETPGTTFGVMIPETKRLDWRFRQLFLAPNSDDGAELMLYDGHLFMFGWQTGSDILFIYDGFSYGYLNVCQFKYVKGGKAK